MQVNYMQYIYRPDSYLSQRLLGMQFSVISYVTRMHHVTMLPGYHVTMLPCNLMAYSTFAYIRLIYMFNKTTYLLRNYYLLT